MAKVELEIDFEALGEELAKHDFVEVVRCKDCKYWEYDCLFPNGYCRMRKQDNPNWFCADGRKDTCSSQDS